MQHSYLFVDKESTIRDPQICFMRSAYIFHNVIYIALTDEKYLPGIRKRVLQISSLFDSNYNFEQLYSLGKNVSLTCLCGDVILSLIKSSL